MFKVAYANKDKIQNSITQGVIPAESLIVTNNDNKEAELSYYDENGNLKSIVKKTAFASKNEALLWIAKYDYSGTNISVFDGNCKTIIKNSGEKELDIQIKGGKFILPVEEQYIAEGYEQKLVNGYYEVTKKA